MIISVTWEFLHVCTLLFFLIVLFLLHGSISSFISLEILKSQWFLKFCFVFLPAWSVSLKLPFVLFIFLFFALVSFIFKAFLTCLVAFSNCLIYKSTAQKRQIRSSGYMNCFSDYASLHDILTGLFPRWTPNTDISRAGHIQCKRCFSLSPGEYRSDFPPKWQKRLHISKSTLLVQFTLSTYFPYDNHTLKSIWKFPVQRPPFSPL